MDNSDFLDGDDSGDWEPPNELTGPTRSLMTNFAIVVLSSPYVITAVKEVIGEIVTEHARFNQWFQSEAKATLDPLKLLNLSDLPDQLLPSCWTAWVTYVEARIRNRFEFPAVETQDLMGALRGAVRELRSSH